MNSNFTTTVDGPRYWADQPGDPKDRGVRINRGPHFLFVPEDELYALADGLVDYIERDKVNKR